MTYIYDNAVNDIIQAGNRLDSQNLAPATSGNYSHRIDENEIAITVSGAHKGSLKPEQVMLADLNGLPLSDKAGNVKTPSAETLLHCLIYKLYPDMNAVLHTHSIACSVLTMAMADDNAIILSGYEMLKAYPDIATHDTFVRLPIFENTQDMLDLSAQIEQYLNEHPKTPAYIIRGHGIYGWGVDMASALRVIEATEMLLSVELNLKQLGAR